MNGGDHLHALGRAEQADRVEAAVQRVLARGLRTTDIAAGGPAVGTKEMGAAVVAALG